MDLYCHEKRLVVELDGPVHDDPKRQPVDANRDADLESLGMTVVRIPDDHLLRHTSEALNEISDALDPSPAGGGAGGEGELRDRRREILFIDARKMGHMVDRTHRDLSPEDIARIADTYHAWRGDSPLPVGGGPGEDVAVYRDISWLLQERDRLRRSASTATSSHPAATSARNRRRTTCLRRSPARTLFTSSRAKVGAITLGIRTTYLGDGKSMYPARQQSGPGRTDPDISPTMKSLVAVRKLRPVNGN